MQQIDPPKVQRSSFMFVGPLRVAFILQPCVVLSRVAEGHSHFRCARSCLLPPTHLLRSAVSLLDTSEGLLTDGSLASAEISLWWRMWCHVLATRSHLHFPSCDFAEWICLRATWSRYLLAPQTFPLTPVSSFVWSQAGMSWNCWAFQSVFCIAVRLCILSRFGWVSFLMFYSICLFFLAGCALESVTEMLSPHC